MKRNERSESDRAVGSISGRSYWIPGSYTPSIVREAQLLFKAIEKEGLQGGKGDNNWVVRHRHIPRPWNPTRATLKLLPEMPDAIFIDQVVSQIAELGRVNPAVNPA